jgi:hypothetical protein
MQDHRHPLVLAAPFAALLSSAALVGCDRATVPEPSPPTTTAATASTTPASPGATDPSLPDARSALGSGTATPSTSSDAHTSLTKAQEATQMPLPGQANDHSLPQAEKRAAQADAAASRPAR